MTTDLNHEENMNIINLGQKLVGLGIKSVFKTVERGPVVTGYFFELDHSIKVSKVIKLSEDFALALGVDNVVVQRVKGDIAVFIPNQKRTVIDFKTILHWYLHDENVAKMAIPIPVGVDFRGNKSAFDLADMPHCLITGSTGSGKSVFESSIICSLGYRFNSSELLLYLVDTKKVDLPLFKKLPHVQNVADDLQTFHQMMTYLMMEVRRRLTVLQGASCRNIFDYHKMNGGIESMPFMILMLDEFGDLGELDSMAKKAGEYEDSPTVKSWIKQASQIGRAAGLHLIACTQRASVKVVDGDIKTNLPCRISLRVPTRVDSQVVLDAGGAENLLGKGDMLVRNGDSDTLQRYHGPYVSIHDITELVVQYDMLKEILRK
jgi:DNA segregation ATPase FtsK/SpoIIIE, S-DNA-T family